MPKSPDKAPMKFNIWGILIRGLQKRKNYTITGLEKALEDEWNIFEQSCINGE